MPKDPYAVLGIKKTATEEETKKAYRKLVKEHHPDKHNGSQTAVDKLKEINEAYQTITKPKQQHPDLTNGFQDWIKQQNNPFAGVVARTKTVISNVINGSVVLTLKEVLLGKENVTIPVRIVEHCTACTGDGVDKTKEAMLCQTCKGSGHHAVNTPIGNFSMGCQQCGGMGKQELACGACSGSGINTTSDSVVLNIPPGTFNKLLQIKDRNLKIKVTCQVPPDTMVDNEGNVGKHLFINYPQMVLGGSKAVTLLDDKEVRIKIPKGLVEGQPFRLAGKGLPKDVNSTARGDLVFHIQLKMPTTSDITSEEEQTLTELRALYDKRGF